MNKKTKQVVYKILDEDEYARENDLYLTFRVLNQMLGINKDTAIWTVLSGMKVNGISFESISRRRRYWLEKHPDIKEQLKATPKREEEEQEYYLEFGNHIPHID